MTDERCDLTDLLIDQCACRNHRGGTVTPDSDAYVDHQVSPDSRWFRAQWPGRCAVCGAHFSTTSLIAYNEEDELIAQQCCGIDELL